MNENYFIFKKGNIAYDSRDYDIVCGSFPAIVIPNKRLTFEEISGRDGSLIYSDDCYSSYTKTIECAIDFNTDIDLTWLSGRGKLILSNEPQKEYDVILKNNIELTQIANYYQNFLLKFEVQPFKKSVTVYDLNYDENEFEFEIGGNARSLPIINLTGTGDIDLTVNDQTFKIKDLQSTIMIDSELEIAIENGENALPKTIGNFPRLKAGINNFIIIGELSEINIKYQETYL